MPENEACHSAVMALRRQFVRIGELLREMEDGRWWPDDRVGDEDATSVIRHASDIEASVQEIARIVAAMKD